ncbi:outer membrane protein [Helicobacter pylori]|uniref:Hop family adhesin SabA n=1 Tax=Helicobacter pylori TaxID=210 RepID=UPI00165C6267|nr:outer membrane protein [Helicobacter pylori]
MNFKKTALLSLTLASALLRAEDDGYFVSIGYQIGGSTQSVKNTGAIKNLNDKYEQLNSYLTQVTNLAQSIKNANNTQAVTNAITNLKSFSYGNYSNKNGSSPIYNITQSIIASVTAFWDFTKSSITSYTSDGCENQVGGYICKPTYEKMAKLVKELEAAKSNLCSLSGCSTSTNSAITTTTTSRDASMHAPRTHTEISQALRDAQSLMNLFKKYDPWVSWGGVGHQDGSKSKAITKYEMFKNVEAMLPLLQSAINLSTQNYTNISNLQSQATGNEQNDAFRQNIYQAAQDQKEIITNAQKIFELFSSIPEDQFKQIQLAYDNTNKNNNNNNGQKPNANSSSLETYVNNIKSNVNYYGDQIESALQTARDIFFLQQNKQSIQKAYSNANDLSKEIQGLSYNKINVENIISVNADKNAPEIDKYNYKINQAQVSDVNAALNAMAKNPFRNVGFISSQSNGGVTNGIGIQLGYKQFFGAKKNWGARYYGFFDYNHTYIKSNFFSSASNILTYGVASDFLYNFINDKSMNLFKKGGKFSFGGYAGIALAGTSWLNNDKALFLNTPQFNASNTPYKADVSSSNFQFLFNFGLRANFAEESKGKHAIQHGVELGLKIPTINTSYYSFLGSKLSFRRTFSIYLNYVFAY